MRKTILVLMFAVLALGAAYAVRAQVATTMITVGFNATLKADAGKYMAIPACSVAAKCTAKLQLCNLTSAGAADSAHCIFISANGQAPWSTNLWVGISQTTINSTGASSIIPYGFGTLNVSVPNNELNITP